MFVTLKFIIDEVGVGELNPIIVGSLSLLFPITKKMIN